MRDYIHVDDLADAHLLGAGLPRRRGGERRRVNCGMAVATPSAKSWNGPRRHRRRAPCEIGPGRPGDPAGLVSASEQIRGALGWEPRYDDLRFIVETAMDWERRLVDERV